VANSCNRGNMYVGHINTVVQTVFAIFDKDGNLVKQEPVTMSTNKLSEEEFMRLAREIQSKKNKLQWPTE
jgi:hypothetical protein